MPDAAGCTVYSAADASLFEMMPPLMLLLFTRERFIFLLRDAYLMVLIFYVFLPPTPYRLFIYTLRHAALIVADASAAVAA